MGVHHIMNGLNRETKLELLRIGAARELPKAVARVNALQRILGVKTRQAKAGLTPIQSKSVAWTPAKRRMAAARMKQYWKKRREEEATKTGRRKAS
jgi:hypothetical protein